MTDRKATQDELAAVLTARTNDEWYEMNRELMEENVDRKDLAFRAISGLGMDRLMAEETIAKFAERLAQDPNDAFSWGEQAINASGTVSLATEVGYWLENMEEFDFDKMVNKMLAEVVRERGYGPASSTSSYLQGEQDVYRIICGVCFD
jgi:hypothetical protein